MAKSCAICPQVRLSSGVLVDSKLFQELMKYTNNNRKLVKSLYRLSKSESFRDDNGFNNVVNQDENGEPDALSFISAVGLDEKDSIISFLDKDLQAGEYTYDEAVEKITKYNAKDDQYKKGYLATLEVVSWDDNKYRIYITKDTYAAQQKLVKTIKKETAKDRFKYYLNRLGVTYSFESDWGEEKIDDFYNLVHLPDGMTASMALGCGNFAVEAMKQNALMQRLITILTPEVRAEIFKRASNNDSDYAVTYDPKSLDTYTDENGNTITIGSREEAAGFLIAQALMNNEDRSSYVSNWVNRVVNKVKSFFTGLKRNPNYISKEKLLDEINVLTREIVSDFTSVSPDADISNIVSLPKISLNKNISIEEAAFNSILQQIKVSIEKLDVINPFVSESIKNFTSKHLTSNDFIVDSEGNMIDDTTRRALMLDKIGEVLQELYNTLDYEITTRLKDAEDTLKFDPENPQPWLDAYSANATLLRASREKITLIGSVLEEAAALTNKLEKEGKEDTVFIKNPSVKGSIVTIKGLIKDISQVYGMSANQLLSLERNFFAQFLAFVEGGDQIQHSARILFRTDKTNTLIAKQLGLKPNSDGTMPKAKWGIYKVGNYIESIREALESIEDVSLFSQWVASMSNSEDVIQTLLDKRTKLAQKQSDDACYKDADTLIKLREEGVKLGFSHDLHEIIEWEDEVDEHGFLTGRRIPTGNFLQEFNYGKWEDDWENFKKELKATKEFRQQLKAVMDKDHISRGLALEKLMKKAYKEWNKEHSTLKEGVIYNTYIPNSSYKNPDWEKLTDEQKAYIQKWINFKAEKEERITGTRAHRLPQISGAAITTLSQHIKREGLLKGVRSAVFPRLKTALVKRLDPQEFGTDATYNQPNEDFFDNNYRYELEKIHRLPVYGVNKYNKEDRKTKLSTNIVNTMLAYCVMCNTYNSFSDIINTLEVGRNVLEQRETKIKGLRKTPTSSKAYFRFDKFMDKQVYNINKAVVTKSQALTGLINGLSSLASIAYLGGNIPGGAVNLGTGLLQLYVEANVGEWIKKDSLLKAESLYLLSLPNMMMEDLGGQASIGRGLTKMSLFIDKMNALGDSKFNMSAYEEGFAGWVQRVLNPVDVAMLPYSIGEKMMQGVTYTALAMDTPVIDISGGKQIVSNVWKMYSKVKKGKGINKYSLEQTDGTWVVPNSKYDIDTIAKYYNTLQELKAHLNELKATRKNSKTLILGSLADNRTDFKEALEFLGMQADTDITTENINKALFIINSFFDDVEWNSEKESNMMDIAREVNNRLHGIYNKQDKTALTNNVVGQMIMVLKNYALGYIQAKFAPDHYSEVFKEDIEGSFDTMLKVWGIPSIRFISSVQRHFDGMPKWDTNVEMNFIDALRATFVPSKKTMKMMEMKGFSAHQFYNMKRNNNYFWLIAMLEFIKWLSYLPSDSDWKKLEKLEKKGDDRSLFEDYKLKSNLIRAELQNPLNIEDNKRLFGMLNYFSMRLSYEQQAYMNPIKMFGEASGLFNLSPVGLSIVKDMAQVTKYAITGETYSKDDPKYKYEAGEKKATVKAKKLIPYVKSIYWFEHPYEARESYEYGVSLRNGTK